MIDDAYQTLRSGWALMVFGEIRAQVEAERPTRTLPEFIYVDDRGRADPWLGADETTTLPALTDDVIARLADTAVIRSARVPTEAVTLVGRPSRRYLRRIRREVRRGKK